MAGVLIVERLIPDELAAAVPVLLSDLHMMVFTSGQERMNAEYGRLLAEAGLNLASVQPVTSPNGVIEQEMAGLGSDQRTGRESIGAALLLPVGESFGLQLLGSEDEQFQGCVDLPGREAGPGDGGLSQLSLGDLGDAIST